MCGIGGIKRMAGKSALLGASQIALLLLDLESRGIDATGVCLQREDGSLSVYKNPDPAWRFLGTPGYQRWLEGQGLDPKTELFSEEVRTVILHTRASTKGLPMYNVNNHPVTIGRTAAVHNGVIWNDDDLFRTMKLKRSGEVDSDIIRAILDEHGLTKEGVRMLNMMRGSAAIAAVSTDFPGKLLLCRSGSPLVMAALEEKNWLMWASQKTAIHDAARDWVEKWGAWFKTNKTTCLFNPVEKEIAYLIGEEGVEWSLPFTSASGRVSAVVYRNHENWPGKQKRQNEHLAEEQVKALTAGEPKKKGKKHKIVGGSNPERVVCRNDSCRKVNKLSGRRLEIPLWQIKCGGCGSALEKVEMVK